MKLKYDDEKFKSWKRQIKIEDNTIKDVRNVFRLKEEIDYTTVKDIRNLFKLKKRKCNNYRENVIMNNPKKLLRGKFN